MENTGSAGVGKTGSLLLAQYYHFNGKLYKMCRREKAVAQQEKVSSDSQTGRTKVTPLNSDIDGVDVFSGGSQVELALWAHKGKTDVSKNAIHLTCSILLLQGQMNGDLRMTISLQLQMGPRGTNLAADI